MTEDGVACAINSGKKSEFQWKVDNFSLEEYFYYSPEYEFEGESWYLSLYFDDIPEYMSLCLWRSYDGPPMEVEFSVSLENTEGTKSFERRERHCFEGLHMLDGYDVNKWFRITEFSNREREFLTSGCLTILLTMKKADSGVSENASTATESSCCKESFHGDKITFPRNCLDKSAKCPQCDELVNLQNWFDHECKDANMKAASAAAACFCCKGDIHGDKISFHKDCLNKETKCPRCDEVISLQNYFEDVGQTANVPGGSSTSQTTGSHHKENILQDLKKLFLNQKNCDAVLRVQGQEFSAHQAILSARSPILASTFRSNMIEKEAGTVDIEDIDPSCFAEFLCFLYCGELDNLSAANVHSLFSAADKYQIMDLRAICLEFMKNNLSVDTFCETLVLALLHIETELIGSCTDYFLRYAEEILVTVKWQRFSVENPTESNELFLKYVKHVKQLIK